MTDVRLTWPGRRPVLPLAQPPCVRLLGIPASGLQGGRARLLAGEALAALDRLIDEGQTGQVDLAYLDPPFGAGVQWPRRVEVQTGGGAQPLEVIAYDDPASGLAEWLQHLDDVLDRVHRLLSPRGSVYLHLDFRRAPHARLLLDERFGPGCLRNEIVWAYGLGGSSADRFGRKHDVIQFYAKDPKQVYFRAPLQRATSVRLRGQAKRATDVWQTASAGPAAEIEDAWPDELVDLTLSNSDGQRTGYPTQKPLALLARMVHASLPPGGLALDPMAGSGTLAIAAVLAGGAAICADRSLVALDAARGRLVAAGAAVTLDAVAGGAAWRELQQPAARVQGGVAARLESELGAPGGLPFSAWGVVDADGNALAWWDAGADRVRSEVPQGLAVVPGAAAAFVAVDVAGQLWRSPLA